MGAGESVDFKSISFWYTLYIQPAPNNEISAVPILLSINSILAPITIFGVLNRGNVVFALENYLKKFEYSFIKMLKVYKDGNK